MSEVGNAKIEWTYLKCISEGYPDLCKEACASVYHEKYKVVTPDPKACPEDIKKPDGCYCGKEVGSL